MSDGTPAVVLIEPDEPGNIGTAARAMSNFGFGQLFIVERPLPDPDSEAYGFAGQARSDVLPNARHITFDELVDRFRTVGFTSVPNENATSHVRFPFVTPAELADELEAVTADVALVFGRERIGLTNDELARLDQICCIPANVDYPALNLGQAVTITLYELQTVTDMESQLPARDLHRADESSIERLYECFDAFLDAINHPREKRPKAGRMMRRLIGRADPTDREVATLTGLFRRGAAYATPPTESSE